MTMKRAGLLLALSTLACFSAGTPALLEFTLVRETPTIGLANLRIRMEGPDGARSLGPQDFQMTRYAIPHTPKLETTTSGDLAVSISLVTTADTIARADLSLPLRSNWEWGVAIRIGGANPQGVCFGCSDILAVPIAAPAPAGDSMFVSFGGHPRGADTSP